MENREDYRFDQLSTYRTYHMKQDRCISRGMSSKLAYCYWLFMGFKPAVTYILFQNSPWLGSLIATLIGTLFAFLCVTLWICREKSFDFRNNQVQLPRVAYLIMFYAIWSLVSLIWTHASSHFRALGYWLEGMQGIVVVLFLAKMGEAYSIGLNSLKGFSMGGLVLASVALFDSAGTLDNRLGNSQFLNPNSLGNALGLESICILFLVFRARLHSRIRLIWGAVSIYLVYVLFHTLSKTSIISFFIACLAFVVHSKMRFRTKVVLVVIVGFVVAGCYGLMDSYLYHYINYTGNGKAINTLSGRALLWPRVWEMIQLNPWLGYGFFSFQDYGPQIFSIAVDTAHDEWLQQWFTLGIVGIVLTASIYIGFLTVILKRTRDRSNPSSELGLALLVYCLIRGLTEASDVGLVFPFDLMFLILFWSLSSNQKMKRVRHGRIEPNGNAKV